MGLVFLLFALSQVGCVERRAFNNTAFPKAFSVDGFNLIKIGTPVNEALDILGPPLSCDAYGYPAYSSHKLPPLPSGRLFDAVPLQNIGSYSTKDDVVLVLSYSRAKNGSRDHFMFCLDVFKGAIVNKIQFIAD